MYAQLRKFEITLETIHGFKVYDSVWATSPQQAEIDAANVYQREYAYQGKILRALRFGTLTQAAYERPAGIDWS